MKITCFLSLMMCSLLVGGELSAAGQAVPLRERASESANCRIFSVQEPPLLPLPQKIVWAGKASVLDKPVQLLFPEKTDYPEQGEQIRKELGLFLKECGVPLLKAGGNSTGKSFKIEFVLTPESGEKTNPEGYTLISTGEGVAIRATDRKGLYYGWQTLRQLISRRDGKTWIAHAEIDDFPKFPIRGFMNDTGRNYMSMDLLKEEVDVLALYKYNVYHFHFTDNHGWRLESKKYPELQDPASFDRKPGKFYTQKEFVDFVEYCRLRNITVIPELDMPGHTQSFRKALKIDKMEDPKATGILTDLIRELASLVPAEQMPYIHIGTDEAHGAEVVSSDTLKAYFDTVYDCGRRAIRWQPGMSAKGDNKPIQQLWTGRARSRPTDGADYIDSLENYLNHLDPFEAMATMYFRKNCALFPKANGLGGILCSWPDLYIEDERNQLRQSCVFSTIPAYSEALWTDPREQDDLLHYSNLPLQGDPKLEGYRAFENRLLAHRDRFFRDKEFSYVRQSDIPWKLIGPFPNGDKPETSFPVEDKIQASYTVDGKEYTWSPETYTGATLIFKHYCDYPTFVSPAMGKMANPRSTYYATTFIYSPKDQTVPFWISGHYWPNSDFREGPVGVPGKWFHTDPQFYVNGKAIPAPEWKVPNRNKGDAMKPLVDENYHFRKPTPVALRKGWNRILIKSPHASQARRWMFTFVPVAYDEKRQGCNVREFPGLKFSVDLKDGVPVPGKK